jgi:CPA1 family monovalent cation:H+ antiporter
MTGVAGATAALAGLLGAAVLVAIVAERVRVPSAVALVAFGTAVAAVHPFALPFHFGETLLFVLLPPLIFEASWNVDPRVLRAVAAPVILLAFPGVLLSAAIVEAAVVLPGLLAPASALVLAAIVAPTDPVAVISIFRRLRVPAELVTIVEGESIANDGVAIVLFGIALAFAAGSTVPSAGGAAMQGLLSVVLGCAIGALCAGAVALAIGHTRDPGIVVAATIALAFGAYLAADAAHASGVFATAAAALVLRANASASGPLAQDIDAFWSAIAFVANAFVFLSTGLGLQLARVAGEPALAAMTVAAVVLARLLLVAAVIRTPAWRAPVLLAGMRGGLSLALALVLPANVPGREAIVDAVLAVVFVTLVGQGLALGTVVRRALPGQSGRGGPP